MKAFALDEVERDLQSAAAQLVIGPLAVSSADDAADRSTAGPVWSQLGGWTELRDHSCAAMTLFLEELARAVRPNAFFASAGLADPFVREALPELHKELVRGMSTVSLALDRNGTAGSVPDEATVLDLDLVDHVARLRDTGDGAVLEVYARDGVAAVAGEGLDLARRPWRVDLTGARPVVTGELSVSQRRRASTECVLAVCADIVGAAAEILRTSVAYAMTREQFGRPIGAFQAVQHRLVAVAVAVERARAATHAAAMAVDDRRGPQMESRATHVAKLAANRAARAAADNGVQVHGGIGFTWENPLHLHVRRAAAGRGLCGDSAWHVRAIADLDDIPPDTERQTRRTI